MSTLTLHLDEAKVEKLTKAARAEGIELEELFRRLADDYLARKHTFDSAADYVLKKNAELHRRLAQ